MLNKTSKRSQQCSTRVYEIRIRGPLDVEWSDWFEGMRITFEEDGNTLFSGPVVDQAALYGILKKVHQLGLQLISVNKIEADESYKSHKRGKNI